MPNMVGCQQTFETHPYLIKQILRYISRSDLRKKHLYFIVIFFWSDLWMKQFPLHLGNNWQNSKVDDEGSLGWWFHNETVETFENWSKFMT